MVDTVEFASISFMNRTPRSVVSKCALAEKQKASLVQREVARQRRGGGIVKSYSLRKYNPSPAHAVAPVTQGSRCM
jgi:hypothetical protein